MGLDLEAVVIDAVDPVALGRWWAAALGWVVTDDEDGELTVRPGPDRLPALFFARVPEPGSEKARLHLDLRPDDQAAEVARLLALGATPTDVGQGEATWVVLADPEGNEFCVLSSRTPADAVAG